MEALGRPALYRFVHNLIENEFRYGFFAIADFIGRILMAVTYVLASFLIGFDPLMYLFASLRGSTSLRTSFKLYKILGKRVVVDWKEIGLKVGFEIHQQLDTPTKLFCRCPNKLIKDKKPDYVIKRTFRAVAGELEEVDIAARFEQFRKREVIYYAWDEVDCLVDIDEEPPHEVSKEALLEALRIAIAMNCEIPDEIHVMRKTIVDGSCPSGFQRTILIGMNGYIEVDGKRIGIGTICLEEDSARKVGEEGGKVIFALDRLGIPLIEIRTDPDIETPEEAKKVAEYIGLLLRSFKVRRGLGTIRQDVNVSIKGGARVEIKGVQDLNLIPKIVEYEAIRQINLLKIRDELRKRGLEEEDIEKENIVDVTEIFKETNSKIIKRALKKGGKVLALKLPKFKGLIGKEIQPGRRLGTEFADLAKSVGLGGIFHSDELPNYGISKHEIDKVKEILKCEEMDGFVLVAGEEERCKRALILIKERAKYCLVGVPKEVRKANPDGTTSFLRPMPGAARMYPETDLVPIKTREYVKMARETMPELFFDKLKRFQEQYGLSREIAFELIKEEKDKIFEEFIGLYKIKPGLLASFIMGLKSNVKKEFNEEVEFNLEAFRKAIELFANNKITKEAFYSAYYYLYKGKSEEEVLKEFGKIRPEEIKEEIEKLLEETRNPKKVVGMIVRKYRKRVDGKEILEFIERTYSNISNRS